MSEIMNKDYMKNINKFIQMLKLLNAEYKKYNKLFKKGYVCEKNFDEGAVKEVIETFVLKGA